MDILFLQNIWFEFLGTMSLIGSVRKAGFDVGLSIGNNRKLLMDVATHKPTFVAFSCVTGIQGWALNLCSQIKGKIDPEIRTVMGGPHPTFFPEIIENHSNLDFICIGEGEEALIELLKSDGLPQAAKKISNIHVRIDGQIYKNPVRPLIQDIDSLPLMDRELYYRYKMLRENPVKRLISGKGCPNACSFCFNHSAMKLYQGKGKYVRKRSVDSVMDEIHSLKSEYPVKTLRFEDDLFGVSKKWLFEFCDRYKGEIPFICSMRADALDRETVTALKSAGCFNVVMGVESGVESIRNDLLKKNIFDYQLKKAASLLHEFKINFCTTNILGLPGETFHDAIKTMKFTLDLKPAFTWCSVFQPYPRTDLGKHVLQEKLVDSLDVDKIEPNYHSKSLLKQPDINRCVNLHKFFYIVFNHRWTLPLVKLLSKLPPNPLYTLIHRTSFLFIYSKRWNISIHRAVKEAIKTSGFTRKTNIQNREIQ